MQSRLFERFITTAKCAGVPIAKPLQTALQQRLHAAELATPSVTSDPSEFLEALCTVLKGAADPSAEMAKLHIEDMYFAWALGQGEKSAYTRFEHEFISRLHNQVSAGTGLSRTELEQEVRTRLFVSSGARPPRISQYAGRGPFGAWLRMIAKRAALDIHRSRGTSVASADMAAPEVPTDPELDYLKLRYGAEFKLALEQALAGLDPRQVTLLKLSYLEQLSASAMGLMYGVSSRTVQRWLVEVREAVLIGTRKALETRLSLRPAELDSLLGLMQSQMHLSLQRILDKAESR